MVVMRRPKKPDSLDEATLLGLTGISRRTLTRWRQQGLVLPEEQRHGLGQGPGTTQLEYPAVSVAIIKRIIELRRNFKKVDEWRWRLWLEGYPVRIAPDLAKALDRSRALATNIKMNIKTLDDIETKIFAHLWGPADLPRGNPLRAIFRGLSQRELRSLMTMIICIFLGIRLPLFDEPDPSPFRVFKRAFGLPEEWKMPPGLFDVCPHLLERIRNALLTATPDELEGARWVCCFLSRFLGDPEEPQRDAIVVRGTSMPWRSVKVANLMWPWLGVRAALVGFIIFMMRSCNSEVREDAAATVTSVSSQTGILLPVPG
jgi:hypothetical protein